MLKELIGNKYVQLFAIVLITPVLFKLFSLYISLINHLGRLIGTYLATL